MTSVPFLIKKWVKSRMSRALTSYLGPTATSILVELDDMKLLVPASDLSMARSLYQHRGYNKPLVEFLQKQISADANVLFIGTHIGSVLIPVAKRCKSVVGVEANPDTFSLLQKNLLLNGVTNTRLLNYAAFDKKGALSFMATRDNSGGSKVAFDGANDLMFRVDPAKRIEVPGERVDDIVSDRKFDLIVMDIEGSEHKALKGMPEILGQSRKLVIEILPLSVEKVARITPAAFFEAIPARFCRARPIHAEGFKESYARDEFPVLYTEIARRHWLTGVDVLFEAD